MIGLLARLDSINSTVVVLPASIAVSTFPCNSHTLPPYSYRKSKATLQALTCRACPMEGIPVM